MAQVPFMGLSDQPAAPGTIIPDDYQRIQSSPDDFGAAIGQADQRLAGGFEQAAASAQQTIDLHNRAVIDDSGNSYGTGARTLLQGDPNDPANPGFLTLQGKAALQAWPTVQQKLQDLHDNIAAGLNPAQRIGFDQENRRYMNSLMGQVGTYADQQGKVYRAQVAQATVENRLQDASFMASQGNVAGFTASVGSAQKSAADWLLSTGAGDEAIQASNAKIASEGWSRRILTTSVSDPVGAQKLLNGAVTNNLLSPTVLPGLMETLKGRVDTAQGQNAFQAAIGGGSGAVSGAGVPSPTDLGGTVDWD